MDDVKAASFCSCRGSAGGRGVHVVDYSEQALREVADAVVTLAGAEDLPAHGQAVTARFGASR